MKTLVLMFIVWLLCVAETRAQNAGPVAPLTANRVLELDGNGSYVVLPPNIFTNLTEATVEVWAKWESFQMYSRVFEFGAAYLSMSLFNHAATPDLRFNIYPVYAPAGSLFQHIVRVNDLLRTNEWIHLAAISGRGGMKLYANGVLVGQHTNQTSFADIKVAQTNILGRGLFQNPTDQDFRGQMDEFRVWNHRRTEEQIRENIFKPLAGTEPGLVGLWNFDNVENGVVTDGTSGGHHGKLMGNAKTVAAQLPASLEPVGEESVLQLNGTNSFVELPAIAFTNLNQVTVEGWIKWESFGNMSRFFDFTLAGYSLDVQNRATTPTLHVESFRGDDLSVLQVPGILSLGKWIHVAATAGKEGLKLFVDGVLVSTNIVRSQFSATGLEKHNYLGRSNFRVVYTDDADFQGQMDEVRVWRGERTEAQIRENLFKNLTGTEEGLAALWNFNDGTAKDSSTNGHHGTLAGNARAAKARRPSSSQLNLPTVLFGRITDGAGNPLANATIRVFRQEQAISTSTSRPDGSYSAFLRSDQDTFDVEAGVGDLGAWVMGVTCPRGQRKELNFTLSSAVSIAGKVTSFDGSPLSEVIVQVVRADASAREPGRLATPGLVATMLTTTTNAVAGFRFSQSPRGRVQSPNPCPGRSRGVSSRRGLACGARQNDHGGFSGRSVSQRPVAALLDGQRLAEQSRHRSSVHRRRSALAGHAEWHLALRWHEIHEPHGARWTHRQPRVLHPCGEERRALVRRGEGRVPFRSRGRSVSEFPQRHERFDRRPGV